MDGMVDLSEYGERDNNIKIDCSRVSCKKEWVNSMSNRNDDDCSEDILSHLDLAECISRSLTGSVREYSTGNSITLCKQLYRWATSQKMVEESYLWLLQKILLEDSELLYDPCALGLENIPDHKKWYISHHALIQNMLMKHRCLRTLQLILIWLERTYDSDSFQISTKCNLETFSRKTDNITKNEKQLLCRQNMIKYLRSGRVADALVSAEVMGSWQDCCLLSAAMLQIKSESWFKKTALVPLFGEYSFSNCSLEYNQNAENVESFGSSSVTNYPIFSKNRNRREGADDTQRLQTQKLYNKRCSDYLNSYFPFENDSIKCSSTSGEINDSQMLRESKKLEIVILSILCGREDVLQKSFACDGDWKHELWLILRCSMVHVFNIASKGVTDSHIREEIKKLELNLLERVTKFLKRLLSEASLSKFSFAEELQIRLILTTLCVEYYSITKSQSDNCGLFDLFRSSNGNFRRFGYEDISLYMGVIAVQEIAYYSRLLPIFTQKNILAEQNSSFVTDHTSQNILLFSPVHYGEFYSETITIFIEHLIAHIKLDDLDISDINIRQFFSPFDVQYCSPAFDRAVIVAVRLIGSIRDDLNAGIHINQKDNNYGKVDASSYLLNIRAKIYLNLLKFCRKRLICYYDQRSGFDSNFTLKNYEHKLKKEKRFIFIAEKEMRILQCIRFIEEKLQFDGEAHEDRLNLLKELIIKNMSKFNTDEQDNVNTELQSFPMFSSHKISQTTLINICLTKNENLNSLGVSMALNQISLAWNLFISNYYKDQLVNDSTSDTELSDYYQNNCEGGLASLYLFAIHEIVLILKLRYSFLEDTPLAFWCKFSEIISIELPHMEIIEKIAHLSHAARISLAGKKNGQIVNNSGKELLLYNENSDLAYILQLQNYNSLTALMDDVKQEQMYRSKLLQCAGSLISLGVEYKDADNLNVQAIIQALLYCLSICVDACACSMAVDTEDILKVFMNERDNNRYFKNKLAEESYLHIARSITLVDEPSIVLQECRALLNIFDENNNESFFEWIKNKLFGEKQESVCNGMSAQFSSKLAYSVKKAFARLHTEHLNCQHRCNIRKADFQLFLNN